MPIELPLVHAHRAELMKCGALGNILDLTGVGLVAYMGRRSTQGGGGGAGGLGGGSGGGGGGGGVGGGGGGGDPTLHMRGAPIKTRGPSTWPGVG